jgi:hypothetical protein
MRSERGRLERVRLTRAGTRAAAELRSDGVLIPAGA